jgi:hypothetical protein
VAVIYIYIYIYIKSVYSTVNATFIPIFVFIHTTCFNHIGSSSGVLTLVLRSINKMYIYIVPWWRYLLGYRLRHLIIHRLLLPTTPVGITIAPLQTVLSLTVLTIHPFRRLTWPSTISVGARLFTVDPRLSLSLLSPTTDWLPLLSLFSAALALP